MPDEPTQATGDTEEPTKTKIDGTSKGSQGSYGTRAPEPTKTSTGGTSKGNDGSYGAR